MDLIKIANYIRQNASADYQTKVAELQDGDPIVTLSNPILQYSTVKTNLLKVLLMLSVKQLSIELLNSKIHFLNSREVARD